MLKNIKKRLKNQRGVTLVELLAVVVILGIIAAIAVPNIGGIIDKTKKDAHVANAQQMADAARLFVLGENINVPSNATGINIPLADLINRGYVEKMANPSGGDYAAGTEVNTVPYPGVATPSNISFVNVKKGTDGEFTFTVTLYGTKLHYIGNPLTTKTATL